QTAQAFAVVEQARVEKIRCVAPRLGNELAEAEYVMCQCEGKELLAERVHRDGILRAVNCANHRTAIRCASSRSTSTVFAPRSRKVLHCGSRESSHGTSYVCRKSRLSSRTSRSRCVHRAVRMRSSSQQAEKATPGSGFTPSSRRR